MRPLPNPGSQCYLLSIVYQLYMMPDVRECVLNMKSAHSCRSALVLQKLFLAMSENSSQPVDEDIVIDLYESVQYAIGEGVDLGAQKDACEFLIDLLTSMASIPDEENFTQLFLKGEFVNKLSAQGGELTMEVNEKFFFLSLDVLELESMQQSLAAFMRSEVVDFRWRLNATAAVSTTTAGVTSTTPSTLKTEKSLVFKQLPRHLIFQLNRFQYDHVHNKKKKLHSRFTFPVDLDMRDYLPAELQAPENSQYKLSGVVIHRGSSAYKGHYVSFIRSRENAPENEWKAYDDEHIDLFGEEFLGEECFGRSCRQTSPPNENGRNGYDDYYDADDYDEDEEAASFDGSSSDSEGSQGDNTPRSAMLLFYDRVVNLDVQV